MRGYRGKEKNPRKKRSLTGETCCSGANVQPAWVACLNQNVISLIPHDMIIGPVFMDQLCAVVLPVLILINHSAPISNTPIRKPPNAMPRTPAKPKSKHGAAETHTGKKQCIHVYRAYLSTLGLCRSEISCTAFIQLPGTHTEPINYSWTSFCSFNTTFPS